DREIPRSLATSLAALPPFSSSITLSQSTFPAAYEVCTPAANRNAAPINAEVATIASRFITVCPPRRFGNQAIVGNKAVTNVAETRQFAKGGLRGRERPRYRLSFGTLEAGEGRLPLLANRLHALSQVWTEKPEHLHRERGVEGGARNAQPIVQRALGKSHRLLRTACELVRHFHRFVH